MDIRQSIVRVLDPDGRTAGTGFIASSKGHILTCSHVVLGLSTQKSQGTPPEKVKIELNTGEVLETKLLSEYWKNFFEGDVAVLKMEEREDLNHLTLIGDISQETNLSFKSFGFPKVKELKGMVGSGIIEPNPVPSETGDYNLWQLRNCKEITRGFSGSPVVMESNEMVAGMTSWITVPDSVDRLQETAFCITAQFIHQLCPEIAYLETDEIPLMPIDKVNDDFIHKLSKAVVPNAYDEYEEEEIDEQDLINAMIKAYPIPIGSEIRRLFVPISEMTSYSIVRLEQISAIYDRFTQYISFILLSQLWNENKVHNGMEVDEELTKELDLFFKLNKPGHDTYNYGKLCNLITDFLINKKTYDPFVDELRTQYYGNDNEQKEDLKNTVLFFENAKRKLRANRINALNVKDFCVNAEKYICGFLMRAAFIVKYPLVTMGNIEFVRHRNEEPKYYHHLTKLSEPLKVSKKENERPLTDSPAVLLLKRMRDLELFLNLSPLIVDENAYTKSGNSRLYMFCYMDEIPYYLSPEGKIESPKIDNEGILKLKSIYGDLRSSLQYHA